MKDALKLPWEKQVKEAAKQHYPPKGRTFNAPGLFREMHHLPLANLFMETAGT